MRVHRLSLSLSMEGFRYINEGFGWLVVNVQLILFMCKTAHIHRN